MNHTKVISAWLNGECIENANLIGHKDRLLYDNKRIAFKRDNGIIVILDKDTISNWWHGWQWSAYHGVQDILRSIVPSHRRLIGTLADLRNDARETSDIHISIAQRLCEIQKVLLRPVKPKHMRNKIRKMLGLGTSDVDNCLGCGLHIDSSDLCTRCSDIFNRSYRRTLTGYKRELHKWEAERARAFVGCNKQIHSTRSGNAQECYVCTRYIGERRLHWTHASRGPLRFCSELCYAMIYSEVSYHKDEYYECMPHSVKNTQACDFPGCESATTTHCYECWRPICTRHLSVYSYWKSHDHNDQSGNLCYSCNDRVFCEDHIGTGKATYQCSMCDKMLCRNHKSFGGQIVYTSVSDEIYEHISVYRYVGEVIYWGLIPAYYCKDCEPHARNKFRSYCRAAPNKFTAWLKK